MLHFSHGKGRRAAISSLFATLCLDQATPVGFNFTFTLSRPLWKNKVSPSSLEVNMKRMIASIENALCWTVLAPLARMNRERRSTAQARDEHDKRRIDVLLSAIVANHGDLLA